MIEPLVSIVVPVFEDLGYLAEAIESLLRQSVTAWEAIVVDDGSATPLPILDRPARDRRIRGIRHTHNRGLAAARNSGIREATTDLIVTLDADDMLDPQYLERVLPVFRQQAVNCVFTDFELFGARHGTVTWGGGDAATLLRHQWIPGPGAAFRRSLWEAAGGYCEDDELRVGDEDREFWISAAEVGLHPVHVPEPLYRYRVGHVSMMTRLDEYAWRTHEVIYRRHVDSYRRAGVGRAFLADGYLTSARTALRAGRRGTTARLGIRALLRQPWRLESWGVIARAALPPRVRNGLRALRRQRHETAEDGARR
jgi:glycosyltransferase involved in cell wall biosynthesis